MNTNGEFYSKKRKEYNEETEKCIEETLEKLNTIGDKPLMMLGKIQSGKTKSFIGVISLAFDNGYDLAVVLTKNSNALAKQTTARMIDEFKEFRENDLVEIFDIMSVPKDMSRFELDKKLIVVVKKEKNNIPKLIEFIEKYALDEYKKCLIIDDEADFCSIGYQSEKDTDIFDLRKIANQINELRLKLTCKFIQVTATPYSLYLQPENISINSKEIRPVKPSDTVLVPYGEGYIGGEYYFDREKNPIGEYLFHAIDSNELQILKSPDRRKFKEEEILISDKLDGIKSAVINFIVGGCIRIIQNGGIPRGKKNKFSFIIHTEISKSAHKRQENIVSELLEQLIIEANKNSKIFYDYIVKAYDDLKESIIKYNFQVPDIEKVLEYSKKAIIEEWLTKSIVNSENDVNSLLDDSGQLRLRSPLNLFIGGQILDRGITVSNLIGFYYGISPQKMQQDTVLQHSRMYGYRSREDLSVTRFYTTLDLYDRMRKINEFDSRLREDFEHEKFENGVVFISRDDKGKIIPCSPQKILISNTNVLKSGKTITPIGFQTGYKSYINKDIELIDNLLKKYNNGNLKGIYKISRESAIEIIEIIYRTLEIESNTCIQKDAFISLIKYLSKKEVNVYCGVDRNISRLRKTSRYYSDMPYNRDKDLKTAKEIAKTEPTLMLMRQNGSEALGWRGAEFYWPVLVVQEKIDTVVYTSSVID